MANSTNIVTILKALEKMPIFKMSLGSKELFHSNFLEFFWDVENDMFIRIMNRLLPKGSQLNSQVGDTYKLSREKENLDICIHHKEGRSIVYDFVLENKVKSMPQKGQLDYYVAKVKSKKYNEGCRFMLLSLVSEIPERDNIEGEWAIVNYLELKNAIEKEIENRSQDETYRYIDDYCKFIEKMHDLQEAILRDFSNSYLFQDVKLCRKYRLHDLYIKLRCDKFLIELKKRLERKVKLPIKFISKYDEIVTDKETQGIYLNTSINQGVGQAAVFIHLHDNKPVNNYEIVIQGKQYRHGINSKEGKAKTNVEAQEQIWNAISRNDRDFLNFNNSLPSLLSSHSVLPNACNTVKGIKRTVPLNGYDTTCIYKHVDIVEDTKVGDLLDHMAQDIIETINTFK